MSYAIGVTARGRPILAGTTPNATARPPTVRRSHVGRAAGRPLATSPHLGALTKQLRHASSLLPLAASPHLGTRRPRSTAPRAVRRSRSRPRRGVPRGTCSSLPLCAITPRGASGARRWPSWASPSLRKRSSSTSTERAARRPASGVFSAVFSRTNANVVSRRPRPGRVVAGRRRAATGLRRWYLEWYHKPAVCNRVQLCTRQLRSLSLSGSCQLPPIAIPIPDGRGAGGRKARAST